MLIPEKKRMTKKVRSQVKLIPKLALVPKKEMNGSIKKSQKKILI